MKEQNNSNNSEVLLRDLLLLDNDSITADALSLLTQSKSRYIVVSTLSDVARHTRKKLKERLYTNQRVTAIEELLKQYGYQLLGDTIEARMEDLRSFPGTGKITEVFNELNPIRNRDIKKLSQLGIYKLITNRILRLEILDGLIDSYSFESILRGFESLSDDENNIKYAAAIATVLLLLNLEIKFENQEAYYQQIIDMVNLAGVETESAEKHLIQDSLELVKDKALAEALKGILNYQEALYLEDFENIPSNKVLHFQNVGPLKLNLLRKFLYSNDIYFANESINDIEEIIWEADWDIIKDRKLGIKKDEFTPLLKHFDTESLNKIEKYILALTSETIGKSDQSFLNTLNLKRQLILLEIQSRQES